MKRKEHLNDEQDFIVNNSVDLYRSYESICNKQNRNIFCNKLDEFKYYYIMHIAQILLKCTQMDMNLPSFWIMGTTGHESEMQDPFHDGDDVFAASSGLWFSHSNILIAFYALLLISFIIFILYKFTPFGFWASIQIRKRINIFNNLPKETLELLENSRSQQLSSEKIQYNVQYFLPKITSSSIMLHNYYIFAPKMKLHTL
ncbi:PIR Superfamily Protein [Plasmodium ovale curtisi]|uniref:PIR Superfamily Protein n=1 Tax=Plasmodium ovale curtisi TaxID=864141 RepID=A0A1A8WSG9_PLAOA|nr:PIR Superfamily Protein [Plasmodium ovale curtisi]